MEQGHVLDRLLKMFFVLNAGGHLLCKASVQYMVHGEYDSMVGGGK